MPTDVGRALSLQQQYALELIAAQAGAMAAAIMQAASESVDDQQAKTMADQYAALLAGAMLATAATRVGYLQGFAAVEGQEMFDIPEQVLRPTVQDVLVGGRTEIPPPRGVGAAIPQVAQTPLRVPSQQGAMWAALADLDRNVQRGTPGALRAAQKQLADHTESTVTATADYVDAMVLGPHGRTAALRRVAHPTACDRCLRCAGVLVFKSTPRPRHPQCRCSFEPVFVDDPEYKARLARYQRNVDETRPGPYGRDRRSRGRAQQEASEFRVTSLFYEEEWTDFLKDEQQRLASIVTTIPSDQYRGWAILTSAKQAEHSSDMLPVITRN
jgi:hypothetical protein